jgi:hypothetical protein
MGLRFVWLMRFAFLRTAVGHDRTAMTHQAFDNVIRFPDAPFWPMRNRGAHVATMIDPVCGRESRP